MNEIKKKFSNPQKPNKKEDLWCGTMLLIIVKWGKKTEKATMQAYRFGSIRYTRTSIRYM